jgi:protein-serine/threonine kinase
VPETSNGVDAINFRNIRESNSLNLEGADVMIQGIAGAGAVPGTPGGLRGMDDGLEPPAEEDAFYSFNSITLRHDGDV